MARQYHHTKLIRRNKNILNYPLCKASNDLILGAVQRSVTGPDFYCSILSNDKIIIGRKFIVYYFSVDDQNPHRFCAAKTLVGINCANYIICPCIGGLLAHSCSRVNAVFNSSAKLVVACYNLSIAVCHVNCHRIVLALLLPVSSLYTKSALFYAWRNCIFFLRDDFGVASCVICLDYFCQCRYRQQR